MLPLSSNGRAFPAYDRSFSLIELAVVVVCIGLLVAILQPSVRDAIGTTQRVKCLERLHQIAHASLLYSADVRAVV